MDEGLSLKVMLTKCLVFSPSSLDYLLIFITECGRVAVWHVPAWYRGGLSEITC